MCVRGGRFLLIGGKEVDHEEGLRDYDGNPQGGEGYRYIGVEE